MGDPARAYPRDVVSPPPTPEAELRRILEAQAVELGWWKEATKFADATEVASAIESGKLVRVQDQGEGYKIEVKGVPEERRCLTAETSALLQEVSRRWLAKVQEAAVEKAQFLVVTSLTRSTDYQRKLQEAGIYPAAEDSSHERGLAFDVAVKWFRNNAPRAAEMLQGVLEELKRQGMINFIDETTVGCLHVCPSPKYVEQFGVQMGRESSDQAAE